MKLIDPNYEFIEGDSEQRKLVIKHTQEITSEFLDRNAEDRVVSSRPSGDFHKFASIPTSVVEKWQREGFDILKHNYSAKEIMAKLTKEDLGAFITTTKRL
jgi:hypothetical protein